MGFGCLFNVFVYAMKFLGPQNTAYLYMCLTDSNRRLRDSD